MKITANGITVQYDVEGPVLGFLQRVHH